MLYGISRLRRRLRAIVEITQPPDNSLKAGCRLVRRSVELPHLVKGFPERFRVRIRERLPGLSLPRLAPPRSPGMAPQFLDQTGDSFKRHSGVLRVGLPSDSFLLDLSLRSNSHSILQRLFVGLLMRRSDESFEERMWLVGFAQKLRMKLAGNEKRVVLEFDHLHQLAVG